MMNKRNPFRRILSVLLAVSLVLSVMFCEAFAKTRESQPAKVVFFYVTNSSGEDVLAKISDIEELKALSHGTRSGENYSFSCTDNLPAPCYAEAQGFTPDELINYMKKNQNVAQNISYSGEDKLCFMADDSNGIYNRYITANDVAKTRKYVEGLYKGWDKFGASRWENTEDRAVNKYKETAWKAGEKTPVILSTCSYSGRATEPIATKESSEGLKEYVQANGGKVKGCLGKDYEQLESPMYEEKALTLYIPTTYDDFMCRSGYSGRTAYDNFKWIYSIKLLMTKKPVFKSEGRVPAADVSFSQSGNTVTVTLSSSMGGAKIYYDDGTNPVNKSSQTLYEKPFTIDVTGRDLTKDPVVIRTHAVKEGCTDEGEKTSYYYQTAPKIEKTAEYTAAGAEDIVLEAGGTVSDKDWNDWTAKITGMAYKLTEETEYSRLAASDYTIDRAGRKITVRAGSITTPGMYNLQINAAGYRDRTINITIKGSAPEITADDYYIYGEEIQLHIGGDSLEYVKNAGIKISAKDDATKTSISSVYIDRSREGLLVIKEDYFKSRSCAVKASGEYTVYINNGNYTPNNISVDVSLADKQKLEAFDAKAQEFAEITETDNENYSAVSELFDMYALLTDKEKTLISEESTSTVERLTESYEAVKQAKFKASKPKITLSLSKTKIKVSWKKLADADGYVVYRNNKKTGGYKKIATVKSVSYTDKKIVKDKTCRYKIRACRNTDSGKIYSRYSAVKYKKVKK